MHPEEQDETEDCVLLEFGCFTATRLQSEIKVNCDKSKGGLNDSSLNTDCVFPGKSKSEYKLYISYSVELYTPGIVYFCVSKSFVPNENDTLNYMV